MEKVLTGVLVGIFASAVLYAVAESGQIHLTPKPTPQTKAPQSKVAAGQPEIYIRWSQPDASPVDREQGRQTGSKDAMDATAMALKREAEILARTQAYNQRPRRMQIGARAQEGSFFFQYIEDWRAKTERVAKANYPSIEHGMQDSLMMTVSIKRDGTVEKITIDRPSRFQVLNEAAERIVRRAAPYLPFPPEMIARDIDVLDITRTWTFTNGKLSTR